MPEAKAPTSYSPRRRESADAAVSLPATMDKHFLLKASNDIRATLRDTKSLGPRAAEFNFILSELYRRESNARLSVDFETIQYAHLDKLLHDLQNPRNMVPAILQGNYPELHHVILNLEKAWTDRFREAWFALDESRMARLREVCMKDIDYCEQHKDILELWTARSAHGNPVADAEFHTGDWWLNLACAHRDGIVGSAIERPTKGLYGVRALPLITGREELLRDGVCKYVRFGSMADMHFSLMSQVGHTTRVIRGYRLRSKLAPAAGVRYDGLYRIRAYSHRYDIKEKRHRLEVTLECCHSQLKASIRVPTPAQIDEWTLFEKHEAEVVQQHHGDFGYTDYKLLKEEDHYLRNR